MVLVRFYFCFKKLQRSDCLFVTQRSLTLEMS